MHKKCWFSFKFLDRELSLEDKLNKCKQEEKSLRGMYTDGYNLRRDLWVNINLTCKRQTVTQAFECNVAEKSYSDLLS